MKKRERIEWCDVWVTDADSTSLPKILLIGDSIARSYFPRVQEILGDRFPCARLATSKCLCDPTFRKELMLVLGEYEFGIVHFNNGLHGWGYDEASYGRCFPETIDSIREHAQGSRLIWANSTPVRRKEALDELDVRTERVRERNRIAREFASVRGIPINDLFGLVVDHPELFSQDGVHFNAAGQAVLGDRVAEFILREVEDG